MDPLTPRRKTTIPDTELPTWITPITLAELEGYGKENGSAPIAGVAALAHYLIPHFWADENCTTPLLTQERAGMLSKRQVDAMTQELFEFSGLSIRGGAVPVDAAFRDTDGTTPGAALVSSGEGVRVSPE